MRKGGSIDRGRASRALVLDELLERSVRAGVLQSPLSGVELLDDALRDALQHLFGEDAQELPAQVQGLKHRAVFIGA